MKLGTWLGSVLELLRLHCLHVWVVEFTPKLQMLSEKSKRTSLKMILEILQPLLTTLVTTLVMSLVWEQIFSSHLLVPSSRPFSSLLTKQLYSRTAPRDIKLTKKTCE